MSKPYLTFASENPFTLLADHGLSWNGLMLWSADTETWEVWDGQTELTSTEHEGEQRIYLRGIENNCLHNQFIINGENVRCEGNIENLLDYTVVEAGEHPTMEAECFEGLFRDCTALITPPELPAVDLNGRCYTKMFANCVGLRTLPELPATTLVSYCYEEMFAGCYEIKISDMQTDECWKEYRIPASGDGVILGYDCLTDMFIGTNGMFTDWGTPEINTTYYMAAPKEETEETEPISFIEFLVNPKYRMVSPFRSFFGWILAKQKSGGVAQSGLVSSDGYTLTDANGLYLIPKESE